MAETEIAFLPVWMDLLTGRQVVLSHGTIGDTASENLNLFGSHSPPLAANRKREHQNTPPLGAGIVYWMERIEFQLEPFHAAMKFTLMPPALTKSPTAINWPL